jgi:hypothetical protein
VQGPETRVVGGRFTTCEECTYLSVLPEVPNNVREMGPPVLGGVPFLKGFVAHFESKKVKNGVIKLPSPAGQFVGLRTPVKECNPCRILKKNRLSPE